MPFGVYADPLNSVPYLTGVALQLDERPLSAIEVYAMSDQENSRSGAQRLQPRS
jgi:hypothetical protein